MFSKNVSCPGLPMMSDFHILHCIFHSLIGACWKEKYKHIYNMLTNLTTREFLDEIERVQGGMAVDNKRVFRRIRLSLGLYRNTIPPFHSFPAALKNSLFSN